MDQETRDNYIAQSELQRQATEGNMAIYAPQLQEQIQQAQAILVNATNPIHVIREIELILMNSREEDGEVVSLGEPLMNQKGLNKMRVFMRGIINQGTILSFVEDKEISKITVQLGDDIADDLALNWKAYDIKDKTTLDTITDVIVFSCFFALKRALQKNEKNWLGRITLENLSSKPNFGETKKGGWMDKFKL